MHINHAELAWRQLNRVRAQMQPSSLIERAGPHPAALRSVASDSPRPSPGLSSDPRGSAVEAGRPANQSDPGDECDCPVCTSDCARVAPCQRKAN